MVMIVVGVLVDKMGVIVVVSSSYGLVEDMLMTVLAMSFQSLYI